MAEQMHHLEAAQRTLCNQLDSATHERHLRQDPVVATTGPEPGWAVYERNVMHVAVNEIRASHGLPLVDLAVIEQIDSGASGHVDWRDKFVLRCAFVAVGEEPSRG